MRKEKKIKEPLVYIPKSLNQKNYIDNLIDDKIDLIIAVGPAGTGKTLFACLKAISQLRSGEVNKLIITRPVVPVEEDIGFLPGNIVKKMDPWTRPIFDLFLEFFSKTELDNYINSNIIEISPLAFMRGRTFKNSFIIADEMQNSSPNQMKLLTTRIGVNSKIVITGDLNQTDIPTMNGLQDFINRLHDYKHGTNNTMENIKMVTFQKYDIERSEIVKNVIDIYDYNKNNNTPITPTTTTTNTTLKNVFSNNSTLLKPSENSINKRNINDNDAALVPKRYITKNYNATTLTTKRHIEKNTDIFWNGLTL
jgi:phosphate starvation-inducible PhoH-like protein